MQHKFHTWAIAAFAAVALFSCQRHEDALVPDSSARMTRVVFSSEMPVWNDTCALKSKTLWDGETIVWSAGDKIALCLKEDKNWHGSMYISDALEGDEAQAEYVFNLPSSLEGSLNFHSIYLVHLIHQ